MKRRDFLRSMAVMPIMGRSALAGSSMLATMKNAYAANGKTLIVIFQRGGCDGLNVVVPYGEDEYYNLRPDIAIPAPSNNTNSALDLNGFFGLHPALTGLYDIYQQGDLAILPTVHYANANKSHFISQDKIESGIPNETANDGWLNRYLSSNQINNELRAVSFSSLAYSLQGQHPVSTLNNLSSINSNSYSSQLDRLRQIFTQSTTNRNFAHGLVHQQSSLALNNLLSLSDIASAIYQPNNNALYPDSNYGQQLKDIANIIKQGIGLEIATVSSGGWDHHANQGGTEGNQANRLTEFSDGINALYKDLGNEFMNDVTILTISEFGRTAEQNASLGTDHGNASSWFVIGKQVNGGIYGEWPGLLPEQLYEGRYLAHTVEYTDIYAELLSKHLGAGNNLSTILPNQQYQPIGFL